MQDPLITQLCNFAEENKDIDVIWLYGSRARNTYNETSDYDLAIAFKHFITEPLDSKLRPELLALDWQKSLSEIPHLMTKSTVKLSIIDINKSPIALAYTIIIDDHPFYINDAMRKLQEENRIMSRWELDYEYSRKTYA